MLASAAARQMRDAAAWTAAERATSNACPAKSAALRMREFSPTYIAPSIMMAGSDMAARLGESMTTPEKPVVGHEPHVVRDRFNRPALRRHVVRVDLAAGVLHVYENGADEVETRFTRASRTFRI